jgi:hypothetical protein
MNNETRRSFRGDDSMLKGVLLLLCLMYSTSAIALGREESALKLDGDPHQRAEGMKELRQISELSENLRRAFGRPSELLDFSLKNKNASLLFGINSSVPRSSDVWIRVR